MRENKLQEREQVGMEGSKKILTGKKEAAEREGCYASERTCIFNL